MSSRQRRKHNTRGGVAEWITHEFTALDLSPPDCTPEALARALERTRRITIEFRPHASDDPGVYGLLYRHETCNALYVILYRPTHNVALRRLILFHELAHILFHHALTEVPGVGGLRGYMITSEDDAVAEAFAVGAMQYSFLDAAAPQTQLDGDDAAATSAFGRLLKKAEYWP